MLLLVSYYNPIILIIVLIDIIDKEGIYSNLHDTISKAFEFGKSKFEKYYNIMDENIIYYLISILDPRVKDRWIKENLPNGDKTISKVKTYIQEVYGNLPPSKPNADIRDEIGNFSLQQRVLKAIHKDKPQLSDIDLYFESSLVQWVIPKNGKEDPNFLLNWWKDHQADYPTMGKVARDYLPIMPSEVDLERLFSGGQDLIGLRRYSLKPETIRVLTLLKGSNQWEEEEAE